MTDGEGSDYSDALRNRVVELTLRAEGAMAALRLMASRRLLDFDGDEAYEAGYLAAVEDCMRDLENQLALAVVSARTPSQAASRRDPSA